MKSLVAVAMAYVLLFTSGVGTVTGAVPPEKQVNQLKSKIAKIPARSVVDVELLTQEKFQGRLAAVTNDSVEVEVTASGKVEPRKLAFTEIKSIKVHKSHTLMYVTLIVLACVVTAGLIWGLKTND